MDDHNNEQQQQHEKQIVQLSPEGQKVLTTLDRKLKLPPHVNSKINEILNDLSEEFLTKVKSSIQDLFFRNDDALVLADEEKTKTIVDKDWQNVENQYVTAIRLFPEILSEKRHGSYPIQWMAGGLRASNNYNLRKVSLIPIVVNLGIELQKFDDELRGGLLCRREGMRNVLQNISRYNRKKEENNKLLDECFLAVWKKLRGNNLLLKEDILQHNIIGKILTSNGDFLEKRFRYFIDWDPMALSMPCKPERGNFLPIHWSTLLVRRNNDMYQFRSVINAGLQYFPEKLGFVFSESTQQFSKGLASGTPFQRACRRSGQERVMKEVVDCIAKSCLFSSTSSSTTITTCTETSLLMSAVTDESIHIDGLYILLRRDPTAALLRLQQHLLVAVVDGQTITVADTDTVTNTNTDNSNNSNSNNNITDPATATATATSNSTSTSSSNMAIAASSSANNNDNDNDNDNDRQQSSSKGQKRKHEGIDRSAGEQL